MFNVAVYCEHVQYLINMYNVQVFYEHVAVPLHQHVHGIFMFRFFFRVK